MNKEQKKQYVKDQLSEYLLSKGINIKKPFRCLNPDHPDHSPSMSYDEKNKRVHCFSCGASYDTFDLIGLDYRLSDSREIFRRAYEMYRLDGDSSFTGAKGFVLEPSQEKPGEDYTDYFRACHERINETEYWKKRGLSEDTARRFQLGYDSSYGKGTGMIWHALIIPTGKGTYVARNTDPSAEKKDRYRKQGGSVVYNASVLKTADSPVFVVEGELDALSVVEAGGEAVALGSTANSRRFLELAKETRSTCPLLICLDNDEDGQKTSNQLLEGLKEAGVSAYAANIFGACKDANEALLANREEFIAAVGKAKNIGQELKDAEKNAYLVTSAAHHLQEFINGIAERADTPCIPTGYQNLDTVLDGGLYEGLYIVGAISSLGKTTFVTQMADQIAEAGTDALIFSLEMARSELMAKSISRLTALEVLRTGADRKLAKTARGITEGKRYANYSKEEKELIETAVRAYQKYAERIYIHEGVGNIGAEQVRETVEKHISITGNRPVVIVDYLQILAPYNDRATDKQNTDKAVLELKRISRDYKIPVIGISSFNRANYNTSVTMEAFKESGAIEYSSDVLIGLQLKDAGTKDFDVLEAKRRNPREVELKILKNRNGPTGGIAEFTYHPMFNYFKGAV